MRRRHTVPGPGEASRQNAGWPAQTSHATGSVTVNAGAESALTDSRRLASLLPVGIEAVDGRFSRGDVIQILNAGGRVLGCGQRKV